MLAIRGRTRSHVSNIFTNSSFLPGTTVEPSSLKPFLGIMYDKLR